MVHSPKMSKKFVPICIVRSDGTAGAISTAPASNSTKRLDPPVANVHRAKKPRRFQPRLVGSLRKCEEEALLL
jgi:hypothetical protein